MKKGNGTDATNDTSGRVNCVTTKVKANLLGDAPILKSLLKQPNLSSMLAGKAARVVQQSKSVNDGDPYKCTCQ